MRHYTDAERALIETFRATGGVRVIFFKRGKPQLPREEAAALSRLVRSGRIWRHATGDFGWVSYRLREGAGGEAPVAGDQPLASGAELDTDSASVCEPS